jgi:biopolymer transport protein ExbD
LAHCPSTLLIHELPQTALHRAHPHAACASCGCALSAGHFLCRHFPLCQKRTGQDISVPAADEKEEKDERFRNVGEIIINIKSGGEIIVNGQQLTEDELLVKLKNITSMYKDQAVILRGDRVSNFQYVINVLDACQKAGIYNIAFATQKPESEAPSN